MGKTVLITGASSGFGLLTSVTLARRGWHVLATMRNLDRRTKLEEAARTAGVLDRIELLELNVTNSDHIAAISDLVGAGGEPLHALVNNAGFAVAGFAEDTTDAELREQFETNFFGTVAVTRALLPQMRRQGFGHVVMVSSISGLVGFPAASSYAASKFALEGWTESLRYELKSVGIQVVLVEPGPFETDIWTRNAKLTAGLLDPNAANAARAARMLRERESSGKPKANPQQVADLIARIVEHPHPKLRYLAGGQARLALMARRVLPWSVWERLVISGSHLEA